MQDYRKLQVWQKAHKFALERVRNFCVLQAAGGMADPRSDLSGGYLYRLEYC